jgi:cell wall-associated NlpC family hydrolase
LLSRRFRTAAGIGSAAFLSLAICLSFSESQADTISTETPLAGISIALTDYYENTSADAEAASQTDVSTEDTIEGTAELSDPSLEITDTVETVDSAAAGRVKSSQFDNVGISVASNYVNIRKGNSTTTKVVGHLYRGCSAKILKRCSNGWVKIKSGKVTGYIDSTFLAIGANAESLASKYGKTYAKVNSGVTTLNVRKRRSTDSKIVTQIPEAESYPVIQSYNEWVKIALDGDDNGFVSSQYVTLKTKFKKAVSMKEEKAKEKRREAAEKAEKEQQEALEKVQESVNRETPAQTQAPAPTPAPTAGSPVAAGSASNSTPQPAAAQNVIPVSDGGSGADIANYALKFVGNPYVYGGSSLINGTDCSGFTMSVYASFGYSLPHNSAAQSGYGTPVSFDQLQPGDLIFYSNGSGIGHVSLYIGGGQVVHASNPSDGIKISKYNYRQPSCARRIVG